MYKTEPHVNEKYRNQTRLWHSYDSQDLYIKNKSHKDIEWCQTQSISYTFNSYGFRCDEFSETKNVLSLGCSFSLGLGIPYESTWSYIVSTKLNLATFNLAIDGASADCCFRMADNWIKQLKPSVVLYQNPTIERLEIFNTGHTPDNIIPTSTTQKAVDVYKYWLTNDRNSLLNYQKNLYAIQYLAESNGAKFLHLPLNRIKRLDCARDVGHYGPKTHQAVAENILHLI